MKNKKLYIAIAVSLLVVLLLAVVIYRNYSIEGETYEPVVSLSVISNSSASTGSSGVEPDLPEKPEYDNSVIEVNDDGTPILLWLDGLEIPEWDGKNPYAIINGNVPLFNTDITYTEYYENYYPLDSLGRCTLADAIVGPETQPTEKRGNISSVKPTGWHSDRYDFVNGGALYNRCHLIAYYLGAENANANNLVTGTRYMNEDGMNDFENITGDYIKETGNHVRYRVTPVWTGDNLICDGLLVEAWSIEDNGEDICFCIYCYNVQPGVSIDYKTGDNCLEGESIQPETDDNSNTSVDASNLFENDVEGTYIINIKKKKFHLPDCSGISDISDDNKEEYTGSRNALVRDGYVPCGGCKP